MAGKLLARAAGLQISLVTRHHCGLCRHANNCLKIETSISIVYLCVPCYRGLAKAIDLKGGWE